MKKLLFILAMLCCVGEISAMGTDEIKIGDQILYFSRQSSGNDPDDTYYAYLTCAPDGTSPYYGNITIPEEYTVVNPDRPDTKLRFVVYGVDSRAFQGNTKVTSVVFRNSIISYGGSTFKGCTALEAVSLSESATEICTDMFNGCTSLKTINIPSCVTRINTDAFENCTSLEEIQMGDGIKEILYATFRFCKSLKKIELPGTLEEIGSRAFEGCESLKEIVIPNTVKTVHWGAFIGCTGVTDLRLSDNMTVIEESTFQDCSSLSSIYWGGVKTIEYAAFAGCTGLKELEIGGHVEVVKGGAFREFTPNCIEKLKIGDSVKELGGDNFRGNTVLTSVEFGKNMETIGGSCFEGCTGLKTITLNCPLDVPSDPSYNYVSFIFRGCTGLEEVIIGDEVKNLGFYAFYECTSLQTVTIGKSLVSLKAAFNGCTAVRRINIGSLDQWLSLDLGYSNVSYYNFSKNQNYNGLACGADLYIGGEKLVNLTLPDDVTSVSSIRFIGCTSLETIASTGNATAIGSNAFRNCKNLKSVTLGPAMETIEEGAFTGCESLETITVNPAMKDFGQDAFKDCPNMQRVEISDLKAWCATTCYHETHTTTNAYSTPLRVAKGLYLNGEPIVDLVIPETITDIGDLAFYNCQSLRTVRIHKGVTRIGQEAFGGRSCYETVSVTVENPDPSAIDLGPWAFYGMNLNECILYVPAGSEQLYADANWWCMFKNIRAIGDDGNAITSTLADKSTTKAYNLNGQPVSNEYKGIVIRDGKKIIKK